MMEEINERVERSVYLYVSKTRCGSKRWESRTERNLYVTLLEFAKSHVSEGALYLGVIHSDLFRNLMGFKCVTCSLMRDIQS